MLTLSLLVLTAAPTFAYKTEEPLQVKVVRDEHRGDILVRELTFRASAGHDVFAYLVMPPGPGPFPAVLFVHWLGEPNSDRTEFLQESLGLAKRGVVSLLINAPWADKDWFDKRTCDGDYDDSIRQVIELRRALDVLEAHPQVDKKRIAYVGHDFGAMYGALLAAVDPRPKTFVLLAGTPHFADWFLLGAQPKDKDAYVKKISELDPVRFIGKATAPVFMQFAEHDKFIPVAKAKEFYEAAKDPKQMKVYPVEHQMNSSDGLGERSRWLAKELGFKL